MIKVIQFIVWPSKKRKSDATKMRCRSRTHTWRLVFTLMTADHKTTKHYHQNARSTCVLSKACPRNHQKSPYFQKLSIFQKSLKIIEFPDIIKNLRVFKNHQKSSFSRNLPNHRISKNHQFPRKHKKSSDFRKSLKIFRLFICLALSS